MSIIQFENGVKVQFEGTPTEKDIEEVFQSMQKQGKLSAIKTVNEKQSQQQKDLLSKAAGIGEKILRFTGGKNIAEIGGSLLAGQSLPQALRTQGGTIGKGIAKTAGDVGAITSTIASFGLKGAATIVGKATQFGGLSALGAGARTMAEGGGMKETAKNAFYAGLTGAAIGGTIGVIGKGLKTFAQKTPQSTYNNALRVTQKIKMAGKSPSDFLVKEGVWGNLGTFQKTAIEGIKQENSIINNALKSVEGGATYPEVKSAALQKLMIGDLSKLFGKDKLIEMIDEVPLASLKNAPAQQLDWIGLNESRSALGSYIGDSKWLSTTPSEKVKVMRAVYGAMADMIKRVSRTVDNFARESKWIETSKAVKRAISIADSKYGLGLYDSIFGVGGAVTGAITGEGGVGERLKRAAVGGITGVALERGVTSPAIRTGIAQTISKINKIPTDTAGRISKTAVITLINNLMGRK